MPQRRSLACPIALGLAAVAGVALFVAALVAPAYRRESVQSTPGAAPVVVSTSSTLVEQNGAWVLALVAIPAVAVVVVAGSIHLRRRADRAAAGAIAWVAVGVLWLLALLGAATIGIFVMPIALLLTVASGTA